MAKFGLKSFVLVSVLVVLSVVMQPGAVGFDVAPGTALPGATPVLVSMRATGFSTGVGKVV